MQHRSQFRLPGFRCCCIALALPASLVSIGCVDPNPARSPTSAAAPRVADDPQLVLQLGENVELLDPATGARWITAWHGGSIFCDVVGLGAVSPDGRFVAVETAPSSAHGADRRFTCRVLDVATHHWSSSLDPAQYVLSFAFSRDASHVVFRRGQALTYSFQSVPVLAGGELGAPGPDLCPSNQATPAASLVALDGRRAFLLVERREGLGPTTAQIVVLELDGSGERTIDLRGSATTLDAQMVEDPTTGALLASTWHLEPDPPGGAADVRLVHELFRVDVARGVATLVNLPAFTGCFAAASGRLVAACRDGARTRLFAVDLASGASGFVDDGGVFDRLAPTLLALSPDGRRVAAYAEPPLRVDSAGSVVVPDTPPRFLVGELGARLERDGHIAPLSVDVQIAPRWPKQIDALRNLALSFSPDGRWLAIAGGGSATGGEIPMPLPSWLRVVDLVNNRFVQSIDGDHGPFPFIGWCVASTSVASK